MQRVAELAEQIDAITATMTTIAEEQRRGILANKTDRSARAEAVLVGVSATQVQLIAMVGALATAFIEYLVDQERQYELGIND